MLAICEEDYGAKFAILLSERGRLGLGGDFARLGSVAIWYLLMVQCHQDKTRGRLDARPNGCRGSRPLAGGLG